MDAIQSIANTTNVSALGLVSTQAVNPVQSFLAAAASPVSAGLFGQSSSIVALSGASQVFSAAAIFQDQVAALQPGAASGIGQNFGSDVTSFAAEAQFLVDAFNGVQNSLATLAVVGGLGSSADLGIAFTQALADAAQTSFDNGDSNLTQLTQIGINFQASDSGGGSLSIDLNTLKSAFASNPAGAFSLLAKAAQAFDGVATDTVGQAQSNFTLLGALTQLGITDQFFGSSQLTGTGGTNLSDLMLLEFLGGIDSTGNSGGALQNLLALNEFNLVSTLLG